MSIQIERSRRKSCRVAGTEREPTPCSVTPKSYASCTATAKSRWKRKGHAIEQGRIDVTACSASRQALADLNESEDAATGRIAERRPCTSPDAAFASSCRSTQAASSVGVPPTAVHVASRSSTSRPHDSIGRSHRQRLYQSRKRRGSFATLELLNTFLLVLSCSASTACAREGVVHAAVFPGAAAVDELAAEVAADA